ncbi:type VI secretion system protein TssA [Caldovatus aquaticus]|uniref:Type VI secretion system protein TssA n=1 Tax=Caldovatus aquaticus TaxID=2865671 RepID=A0ABS7F3P3_9PROT|nr:type VI secretion system protein TssA [Caldovatus aquaticus]MBW8270236.1 type VI secretion system protein TssA [Caldovatus aquaticus]
MAEDVLDLEALLAPLGGEGGAGEDLRNDFSPASPYQKLRDARAEARAEERQQDAEGGTDAPVPLAWREVRRIGLACLAEKSKDFEIAAWTVEALVRLDGLPGLAAGARLLAGLLERYWEAGYPRPDEEGLEVRAAPIGGLAGEGADGTLMQPLRRLPLFRRADGSPVGLHLYRQAEETDALADAKRKKARIDAGMPEFATLQAEAKLDAAHLRAVGLAARAAGEAWAAMDAALAARFGAEAPATRRVAEALAQMVEIAERLLGPLPREAPAAGADGGEAAAEAAPAVEAAPAAAGGGPRPPRTREDAIRQLEELAEWFRRTEPHSPLAFTLEDAVRRARMPLPELLAEVLPDAKARAAMLTMLGIRPPPGE